MKWNDIFQDSAPEIGQTVLAWDNVDDTSRVSVYEGDTMWYDKFTNEEFIAEFWCEITRPYEGECSYRVIG